MIWTAITYIRIWVLTTNPTASKTMPVINKRNTKQAARPPFGSNSFESSVLSAILKQDVVGWDAVKYRWNGVIPLNTWRNDNVVITPKLRHFDVITSKWRRFGVITTPWLCNAFAGIWQLRGIVHTWKKLWPQIFIDITTAPFMFLTSRQLHDIFNSYSSMYV